VTRVNHRGCFLAVMCFGVKEYRDDWQKAHEAGRSHGAATDQSAQRCVQLLARWLARDSIAVQASVPISCNALLGWLVCTGLLSSPLLAML